MEFLIIYVSSVILNLSLIFSKSIPRDFFRYMDESVECILVISLLLPGVSSIVTIILICATILNKIREIYDY